MKTYLQWAVENTKTAWWHDSADPEELRLGLERGAVGVTTNPFLSNLSMARNWRLWEPEVREAMAGYADAEERAEALMRIVVRRAAEMLLPEFERTKGASGFVCAQVNPGRAGDRKAMLAMARRFTQWAPNIAVKLPVTAAGLDVLEDCIAAGITATGTVSFTVPQVIAIAERYRKGAQRARDQGIDAGKCFAVIMIGRLDDYLREVAQDQGANISESDVRQTGLAVTKRAYSIYKERGYEPMLLVAALRGPYHMTELAGGEFTMSIAPMQQEPLLSSDIPFEERIDSPVSKDVLDRLSALPEFIQAYEPDGMDPAEFISFGAAQRTLSQFYEDGWKLLENFKPDR